jgi:D-amino-acid dehydrogenase
MTASSRSVVIVGGGVIGLCAAYSLRQRGADVTVLEGNRTGSGASWGNAGWIVPSLSGPVPAPGLTSYTLRSIGKPDSPVYLRPRFDPALPGWMWRFWRKCNAGSHDRGLHATARLAARTFDLYDGLAADGVQFRMWRDGLLFAFRTESAADAELNYLRAMEPFGYKIPETILVGSDLRAVEPALGSGSVAGLMIGEERHVDPGSLTAGLTARLRELGVNVLEGAEVTSFASLAGRVTAVQTTAGRFSADTFLLAAGAWTTPLVRQLGVRIPMQAGKGYSFSIKPKVAPTRPLYLGEAKVGVSPMGDRVRLAGTMELSGLNLRIDQRRVDAIATGARRYLAEWPDQPVEDVWTGMRPLPADGLPIIGPLPGYDNVVVSTGHAMLGITLGPASAELVADLILDRRTPTELEPFALTRFRR